MLSIANAAALRGLKCGTFYLLRVVKFSQNSGSCRRIEITYIAHIYIELYIYIWNMSTLLPKCKVGAGVVDCLSGVATPGTVSDGAAPPSSRRSSRSNNLFISLFS